ncbi:MAG TPA: helix-turn-helix transcriptional regulator [Gemmatimonadota bacterium]|nr:helix-turn-helix transcriptional regulator [Gemmatimonadota bacterium]
MNVKIGHALKAAREAADLTQESAAALISAERKTIWYWESGKAVAQTAYLLKLAQRSERSKQVLADLLGLGSAAPARLAGDVDLRAALSSAAADPRWPLLRDAIMSMIRAQGVNRT